MCVSDALNLDIIHLSVEALPFVRYVTILIMTHIIVIKAVEGAKDPAEEAVAALIVAALAALTAVGSAAAPMPAGLPPLPAVTDPTNADHQRAGPTVDAQAAAISTAALKPQR